jgi:hypothetical protein
VDDSSNSVAFRDVVVVGGGCYGTFYVRQLLSAAERGRARFRRILVVDRDAQCRFTREVGGTAAATLVIQDWGDFFDRYLSENQPAGENEPGDAIVPSPLMPHLMYEWLLRQARGRWPNRVVETRPVPMGPGTPYDRIAPDGTRYVSYADWLCPTHCIEPATCPAIRAPRTWEMADALDDMTTRLNRSQATAGPVLFVCEHRVYGVGMFDVAAVLEGNAMVLDVGAGGGAVNVLVGTLSSCHGAVNLMHLGAVGPHEAEVSR